MKKSHLIIYIISKVLVSIALIIVGVWIISGKSFVAFSILALPLTLAIQALPLFNRLLAQISLINVEGIKTWAWSINMLVTIIVLFVYILLVFVLKINSDKTKAVEKFEKPKQKSPSANARRRISTAYRNDRKPPNLRGRFNGNPAL